MSKLKESLKRIFQNVWGDISTTPRCIQDMEVNIASRLLSESKDKNYALDYELLSYERLHRYIMVIACPDQAFYPDALRTYLQKQDIQPIQVHTILFSRDENDENQLQDTQADDTENELLVVFHFSAATTDNIQDIERDIAHILEGVDLSVTDFPDMLGVLENAGAHLTVAKQGVAELLHWMLDKHYLLYGLIDIEHARANLGICRRKKLLSYLMAEAPEELSAIGVPDHAGIQWLHITSTYAHIYGNANMRAVQITWIEHDKLRSVIAIGHFSRSARYTNASGLPYFKGIWAALAEDDILKHSAFYHREMRMLFDRTPKSLLHSIPTEQWLTPFKAVIDMNAPTATVVQRLKPRQGNFEYLLLAVDSHRYGDNIWHHMQQALLNLGISIWGHEAYYVGPTHLTFVAVSAESWPHQRNLYHAIHECVVFWKDKAKDILLQSHMQTTLLHESVLELSQISTLYQEQFEPAQFVEDIMVRAQVLQSGGTFVRLKLLPNEKNKSVEIQLLMHEDMPLAQMTEKLNAFALVTMEQALVPMGNSNQTFHICKFRCDAPDALHAEGIMRLQEGITDVFNHSADHDPLNALVILAGLQIRDVLVMITLRNHLAQLMPNVSIGALSEVMIKYHQVTSSLFHIFEGKHRPGMPTTQVVQAKLDMNKAMEDVQNLKEDTWLRAMSEIVLASVRSNAWARKKIEALAIKVDSSQISFTPHPKPYREIFVHGVCVEGVHLRAGPIARGGLRYSDRPTDFRTEVLELMATQVVKNGQIVPTGSKGGFVVRGGEGAAFVLAQYHQFIHALLSITDNLVEGVLETPKGVRIAKGDADDTYLVVAADKGTARYSDDANAEALDAGFWLGDAFASGGSYGYDHKAFGITAKGAWICAAHHFAKKGINLWQDEVRVVGIGDMGGDVFGNGMLLNPNLKLLAAFNHQHIFLDPVPNVQLSFVERRRLFDGVKSWGDYNTSLISQGGGVFQRSSKSIKLSDEIRQSLDIHEESLSGEALIRSILRAPVDLLYNGGIGTYVKASFETDADAQDPANNSVRVDANSLRCKVLNEGGNLGLTQASRIEFAQLGGMINTDAIDNAAGVNMSDHEVNLKILLMGLSFKQRNTWLLKVADDVAEQCLNDNQEQAVALSLAEETAAQHLPRLQNLQQNLFAQGYLEHLEKDVNVLSLRPVLAEWLGHEKNRVHAMLDDVNFRQQSVFGERILRDYFPKALHKKFKAEISEHVLANDIMHTRVASYIVNRYGLTSVHFLQNLTSSATIAYIIQAILIADDLLDTEAMYQMMFPAAGSNQKGGAVSDWYVVQQYVLNFAAGLLAMPRLMSVDDAWLSRTRKVLHSYASEQSKDIVELMPLVTALALSEETHCSLKTCLEVTAQCLNVLPFVRLEQLLRTPLWAGNEAHALRKEWLNRLMLMKVQAAKNLLQVPVKKRDILLRKWQEHPLQSNLHDILGNHKKSPKDDEQRMLYLLALTQLQSIVECECNLA
ncbi:MAG: NAD-glutamate dehydrogenase [Ghiorsea sp.]